MNERLTSNFIKGFADADFSLGFHKGNYPVITGYSKSKELIIQIANFLKNKEISFHIKLDYIKYDSRIKSGRTIGNLIYINGRKNIQLWMNCIGFNMPKFLIKYKSLKTSQIARPGFEPGTYAQRAAFD